MMEQEIPNERICRLLDTIRDYRLRCISCGEHLTWAERFFKRSYCEDCWPNELDDPDFWME